jgi:hypothetical protein
LSSERLSEKKGQKSPGKRPMSTVKTYDAMMLLAVAGAALVRPDNMRPFVAELENRGTNFHAVSAADAQVFICDGSFRHGPHKIIKK